MMPMETVKNCISESLMFPNEASKKEMPQGQMVQIGLFNVCLKNWCYLLRLLKIVSLPTDDTNRDIKKIYILSKSVCLKN